MSPDAGLKKRATFSIIIVDPAWNQTQARPQVLPPTYQHCILLFSSNKGPLSLSYLLSLQLSPLFSGKEGSHVVRAGKPYQGGFDGAGQAHVHPAHARLQGEQERQRFAKINLKICLFFIVSESFLTSVSLV
jgi:hypothetical protein